jgi:hypothetical protein
MELKERPRDVTDWKIPQNTPTSTISGSEWHLPAGDIIGKYKDLKNRMIKWLHALVLTFSLRGSHCKS